MKVSKILRIELPEGSCSEPWFHDGGWIDFRVMTEPFEKVKNDEEGRPLVYRLGRSNTSIHFTEEEVPEISMYLRNNRFMGLHLSYSQAEEVMELITAHIAEAKGGVQE